MGIYGVLVLLAERLSSFPNAYQEAVDRRVCFTQVQFLVVFYCFFFVFFFGLPHTQEGLWPYRHFKTFCWLH